MVLAGDGGRRAAASDSEAPDPEAPDPEARNSEALLTVLQEGSSVGVPTSYRLVMPDGWWAVDLDPARTGASVRALVERQWRGVDNAPHLKAQARAELAGQAAKAREAGGLTLYLSVGTVAGVPLPASLLVALLPTADPEELSALARERAERGVDVRPVRLPAGDAVRSRWCEEAVEGDPSGNVLATTCVDVHVPVPGARAVLLLSFRTSMEPLADVLVELFDAVATTLVLVPPAGASFPDRSSRTSGADRYAPRRPVTREA